MAASPGRPGRRSHLAGALDPFNMVHTPARNYGPATLANGAKITPLARRLAHEAGIDRRARSSARVRMDASPRAISKSSKLRPAAPSATTAGLSRDQVKALYSDTPYGSAPRRHAAGDRRLVQAKQTVPHFYLAMDVGLDKLNVLRDEANAAAPKDRDFNPAFKLSVNDFWIKALALALQRVPAANAVWADDRILPVHAIRRRGRRGDRRRPAHAGDPQGGHRNRCRSISAEMKDLARAARRENMPQEYQGGSTAVSNLSMYGRARIFRDHQSAARDHSGGWRSPTPPGGNRRRRREIPSSQMTATLSCDHRVVDGALGAQLLGAFKALVENPVTMLV